MMNSFAIYSIQSNPDSFNNVFMCVRETHQFLSLYISWPSLKEQKYLCQCLSTIFFFYWSTSKCIRVHVSILVLAFVFFYFPMGLCGDYDDDDDDDDDRDEAEENVI